MPVKVCLEVVLYVLSIRRMPILWTKTKTNQPNLYVIIRRRLEAALKCNPWLEKAKIAFSTKFLLIKSRNLQIARRYRLKQCITLYYYKP